MGKNNKKSTKLYIILLCTIIPFLAFFSYIYLNTNILPSTLVKLFLNIPPKVNYNTFKVSFSEDIPQEIQGMIIKSVDDIQMGDIKRFDFNTDDDYTIHYDQNLTESIYSKQYVFVGHMYWIKGEVSLEEILSSGKVYVSNEYYELAILLLRNFLKDVEIIGTDDLVSQLENSEEYVGIVPLESLCQSMKVLSLDGEYFFDSGRGLINIGFVVKGGKESKFLSSVLRRNMEIMYGESFFLDTSGILKINMAGVVAITRALASKMDQLKDSVYPAKYIGEFLADADITHISNEVSFVENCTSYSGTRFCSKPEYIDTLEASGVDIVELTGNHNNDYGADKNRDSIEIYKQRGWDYFGGGLDTEDASRVLYKEQKGNSVAFIGYNYYDTMLNTFALAKDNHAGANSFSVEKMTGDISEAKQRADIVIVTFQFQECYSYPSSDVIYPICYKPLSNPNQKDIFRKAIDLGADVVVGTQAHQPQTYEMYNGGFIYYGLGNLYFDQTRWIGTRQGLVLSLYIEGGDLIQAKLTPILMGMDMIPRLSSEGDSNLLLNLLKNARDF
jgi:poly-gamma-glutamate capsule biosynthesis protein CapA/YwtB (metallophosphatase superfamily)